MQINNFKALISSIINIEAYKVFVKNKMSKAVGYVFLLTFIAWVFTVIGVWLSYFNFTGAYTISGFIENKVPEFELSDGRLHMDSKHDFEYKADNVIVILDSDNILDKEAFESYSMGIIIDNEKILLKNMNEYVDIVYERDMSIPSYSKADFVSIVSSIENIFIIVIAVFTYIFMVIWAFFVISILILFTFILNYFIKIDMFFDDVFKIVVYSRTLSVLITAVSDVTSPFTGVSIPWYIAGAVTCLYIIFVSNSMKKNKDSVLEN